MAEESLSIYVWGTPCTCDYPYKQVHLPWLGVEDVWVLGRHGHSSWTPESGWKS